MAEKNKGGRPSMYTPELAEEICRTIATRTDGLEQLCMQYPHWPAKTTIYEWRLDNLNGFAEIYARAKAHQADLLVEELSEICNNSSHDFYETKDGQAPNPTKVARDRLRIDTRKWIACKLLPKVYGDVKRDDDKKEESLVEKLLDKIPDHKK